MKTGGNTWFQSKWGLCACIPETHSSRLSQQNQDEIRKQPWTGGGLSSWRSWSFKVSLVGTWNTMSPSSNFVWWQCSPWIKDSTPELPPTPKHKERQSYIYSGSHIYIKSGSHIYIKSGSHIYIKSDSLVRQNLGAHIQQVKERVEVISRFADGLRWGLEDLTWLQQIKMTVAHTCLTSGLFITQWSFNLIVWCITIEVKKMQRNRRYKRRPFLLLSCVQRTEHVMYDRVFRWITE